MNIFKIYKPLLNTSRIIFLNGLYKTFTASDGSCRALVQCNKYITRQYLKLSCLFKNLESQRDGAAAKQKTLMNSIGRPSLKQKNKNDFIPISTLTDKVIAGDNARRDQAEKYSHFAIGQILVKDRTFGQNDIKFWLKYGIVNDVAHPCLTLRRYYSSSAGDSSKAVSSKTVQKSEKVPDQAAHSESPVPSERVTSPGGDGKTPEGETPPEKMGLFKRFHHTYKEYGKALVAVHCVTSACWAGLFYYVAASGVDVEPALRWIGASEKIISFYTMPGVGNAAVAYLFYKLATPVRYPVTIGGTHLTVRYLRKLGYMPPVSQENRIRNLMSEGRTEMRARVSGYKTKIGHLRNEYKERRKIAKKPKKTVKK